MYNTENIYTGDRTATPVTPETTSYWSELSGNSHPSNYILGPENVTFLRKAAASVACLIGAKADEMVFTPGATEANNLALIGLARSAPAGRRRILVGETEHASVLKAAHFLSHDGFKVTRIPVDRKGHIDLKVLQENLDSSVLLVSIMAVNNEIGTIQNIPTIAKLIKFYDIPFHCDAAQAPCAMDICSLSKCVDFASLSKCADLISLSGHKMHGQKGIGALYIKRNLHSRIEPIIHDGNQQERFDSSTEPVVWLMDDMATAAEFWAKPDSAQTERRKIGIQRDIFAHCLLHDSPFPIAVNGPPAPAFAWRHPGNVNLCFNGFKAQDILRALKPQLTASIEAVCTSGISKPSHVLCALDMSPDECNSSICFNFGRSNSNCDVKSAAKLVIEILKSLSSKL